MSDNIVYTGEIPEVLGPEEGLIRKSSIPHYGKRTSRKIPKHLEYNYPSTKEVVVSYIVLFIAYVLTVLFIDKYYESRGGSLLYLILLFGFVGIIFGYSSYRANENENNSKIILTRLILYLLILVLVLITVSANNIKQRLTWAGFVLFVGFFSMLILEYYTQDQNRGYIYTILIIIFAFIVMIDVLFKTKKLLK